MNIPHNDKRWVVKINRHTTTHGRRWGWIEGAPGSACWSDDGPFNHQEAERLAREHNDWLKHQEPIDLQIIRQREKVAWLSQRSIDARSIADQAARRLFNAEAELQDMLRAKEATVAP